MNTRTLVKFAIASLSLSTLALTSCTNQQTTQAPTSPADVTSSPATTTSVKPDVPYVPTPEVVVERMLELAKVNKNDLLYDLGSGDGRIVITAAKKYGAKGVGVEIDPELVEKAKANAQTAGVSDKVEFRQQNLFDVNLSEATVVTLYLLPQINLKLRPQLLRQLKPGTRIVSHEFNMGEWKPEQTVKLDGRTIYVWTVPKQVPPELLKTSS
ncbi:MAG: methyltransferase domain-containing protein [Coleofasciculaceae cyanobacterium]